MLGWDLLRGLLLLKTLTPISRTMPRLSRYSPAEKAAIVAAARSMIRKGESCKNIAQQLGVNQPSLRGWLREATLNMLYPPLPPCMPRNRSAQ